MTSQPTRPRPLSSLLASAQRLTSATRNPTGKTTGSGEEQSGAWDLYGLVGELRYLVTTLASRMAQAKLYVGELADDPNDDPVPVDDEALNRILEGLGGGASKRVALIERLGVNLFVPGEGWLVGIPRYLLPVTQQPALSLTDPPVVPEAPTILLDALDGFAIEDLDWRVLSDSELTTNNAGELTLLLGEAQEDKITCRPEDVVAIHVWKAHPRFAWRPDSPTLSVLTVLRQIVGLDMRAHALITSRLAGAGVFPVPESARRAIQAGAGLAEDDATDVFTEALLEAMMTPIRDRANASAVVPLVVTVPDEVIDKFREPISFANELDAAAPAMMDQNLRRLALSMNAPPELLLGTSGMNHWGAWLVQEDVVSTHLEPPLALVCDAFTTQYLWPVLLDQGMTEEQAKRYVIWYDVSHLVTRPNRSTDALELHSRGVIGDEALRDETGFDESQAPFPDEELAPEVSMALELARAAPALVASPGLPQLAAQIRALLDGDIPEVSAPAQTPPPGAPGGPVPPDQGQTGPTPPGDTQLPQTGGQPPAPPAQGNPQPAAAAVAAGAFQNGEP